MQGCVQAMKNGRDISLGKRGKVKITERKGKGKASNQQERKGESDKEMKSNLRINLGRKCMMKDVLSLGIELRTPHLGITVR